MPVTEPRGWPDGFAPRNMTDLSPSVWVSGDIWLGDHSYSWLNADEFAEAIKRAEECTAGAYGGKRSSEYYGALAFMREMEKHHSEVALVFGFDN